MQEKTYSKVFKTIQALVEGEDDPIARMSTVSCELYHAFDETDLRWLEQISALV